MAIKISELPAGTALGDSDLVEAVQNGANVKLTGAQIKGAAPVQSVNGKTGAAQLGADDVGAIPAAEKGAANGVATLDADGKLTRAQLPALAITDTFVVNSEEAMLALDAQVGDIAIRMDLNDTLILRQEPAAVLSNWEELRKPVNPDGTQVGSSAPQPLGQASPGVSEYASREDHVHPLPSASDIGAEPEGTAQSIIDDHETNMPHMTPQDAAAAAPVQSVNGQTGAVVLDLMTPQQAAAAAPVQSVNGQTGSVEIPLFPPNETIGSSVTLAPGHAGSFLVVNAEVTLTVGAENPEDPFPANCEIHICQASSGVVTVAADAGVTVNVMSAHSLTTREQWAVATLKRLSVDNWLLFGALGDA